MLQKRAQIRKLAHGTNELFQVVEPSSRIRSALRLPHVDVAALLKNELRQLFMGDLLGLSPPAVEVIEQAAQDLTGTRFQFFGFDQRPRRTSQGEAGSPTVFMQDRKRRVAEAALRLVINPLKSEVVVGLGDRAKVGQRVAYFRPLVESWAADDPIRQPQGDEPLLEFSHLKGGADQDGDLVERNAFMLSRFDLLADKPRFFLAVRPFSNPRSISERFVSEQRLSQATAIVGDQSRSHGENVPGRSIVSLEPDDLRAGKILLEAQDVFHIRTAPGVDRLIVVADTAQIAVGLGKEPEKQILDDVRVLILVDQDVAEAPAECGENVGVFAQQTQGLEQEIAEIHRIERFQPLLIVFIQRGAFAAGEPGRLAR